MFAPTSDPSPNIARGPGYANLFLGGPGATMQFAAKLVF
jgi:hypothetical protein